MLAVFIDGAETTASSLVTREIAALQARIACSTS
jgi:hypothetical protein